ncbi:MAG: ABC transporter permease [Planctomycetes bacterium]|nr:ABC transporter permease [Planctomycetota bacterium]MBM4086712.1 ABC transporter permease [Planctomycetota bacterium]
MTWKTFRGLASVMRKEFIHMRRDRMALAIMLAIPCVQLIIFGYAIDTDVRNVPLVVWDQDGSDLSRAFVEKLANTTYFRPVGHVRSEEELQQAIVSGRAKVGLRFPTDFSDRMLVGRGASVFVAIDGSDNTVGMQSLNVVNVLGVSENLKRLMGQSQIRGDALPLDVRPRMLFNPNLESSHFLVPGLVGLIMQVLLVFLTAFSIVREREMGTLEQLLVTPVGRLGLILGKLAPYTLVGALQNATVLLLMRFLFGVPIHGSLPLLAGLSLLFMVAALGIGLFISTVARTQAQALQMAFLVMLPSVLLSGFMFPRESMPTVIWVFTHVIPLTFFIEILRGIIVRGAGWPALWDEAAALALLGFTLTVLAAFRFRKTIE